MNDQKIFECIALNGPMRAQQIAAEMGVPENDAVGQLAALCSVGDIVLVGEQYSFSRKFRISEDCRRAVARADDILQGRAARADTPLDRALSFLMLRGGRCTSSEMHRALGLADNEMPSVVLAEALAAGRLFKEGKDWFLDRRAQQRVDARDQAGLMEDLAAPAAPRPKEMAPIYRVLNAFDEPENNATE